MNERDGKEKKKSENHFPRPSSTSREEVMWINSPFRRKWREVECSLLSFSLSLSLSNFHFHLPVPPISFFFFFFILLLKTNFFFKNTLMRPKKKCSITKSFQRNLNKNKFSSLDSRPSDLYLTSVEDTANRSRPNEASFFSFFINAHRCRPRNHSTTTTTK